MILKKREKMRKMCCWGFHKTAIWFSQALRQVNLPKKKKSDHSHKDRNDSQGKQAELAVLHAYVEEQVTIEPILIYRVSKCKQTKEQDS